MHAAVITSFDEPPSYREFADPAPQGADEVLVDVLASGLHRRVRSQADGSHYTSTGELPLVPGVDGVARLPDGSVRYFALTDTTFGAMAERTVIDLRLSVELPAGADAVQVAAGMNPAMSAWVALKRRIDFTAGQSVLVLGATGASGQMAVQVAKQCGAGQVIAAGRDPQRLAALEDLGADTAVRLDESPGLDELASEVDVVIDYLWGQVTTDAMTAIATHRRDRSRPLTWIEVGSVAGSHAAIPSAALRAVPLRIVGSGQGSVPIADLLAELPTIAAAVSSGTLRIDARAVKLVDVESAWREDNSDERIVLTP
jgi:NADPH:quinone reductase-like Zn-dependent oxidoreductase